MAQRALQRDLQEAEVRDRAKMRELEQQLESLRQEEQMARFDADATTNRVLAEREAAIERLEKRAAREKQDTRAVLQVVEPARTAVRGLAKTVLNTEKEVPVEAPANLAATLRRVESRVAALMGQASDLVQTLSDVEPAAEGREAAFSLRSLFAAAAALERIAAQESAKVRARKRGERGRIPRGMGRPLCATAADQRLVTRAQGEGGASRGATIAGPGMSPYNVRVRSLRSAEQEGDSAAVKAGAGDERDVNRMAAEGHEGARAAAAAGTARAVSDPLLPQSGEGSAVRGPARLGPRDGPVHAEATGGSARAGHQAVEPRTRARSARAPAPA